VVALKLLARTALDLLLVVALGAAIYVPWIYFRYRNFIPDAATPNGGQIALWRSAEALGFSVPALREQQQNWVSVTQSFTAAPGHLPADDGILLEWVRSRPDMHGVVVERRPAQDGGVTVSVYYRSPRRAEPFKVPWQDLGYGRGGGPWSSFGPFGLGLTFLQESPGRLRGKMALSLAPGLLLVGAWRTRRWWRRLIERDRARGVRRQWLLSGLALAAYGTAFFLPAADIAVTDEQGRRVSAFHLSGAGAWDAAYKFGHASWYANPVLWLALLLLFLRRRFLAGAAALTALGLGLTEPSRAAGAHNRYLTGYWLWLGSMLLLGVGSLWAWLRLALPDPGAGSALQPSPGQDLTHLDEARTRWEGSRKD
jgi:hypothetical protein